MGRLFYGGKSAGADRAPDWTTHRAPDRTSGGIEGPGTGSAPGVPGPIRGGAPPGVESARTGPGLRADASAVTADAGGLPGTIDWGTRVPDTVIDVYFVPAGSYPDGIAEFGPSQGFTAYQKRQYFSALEQFGNVTNLQFRETASEVQAEFRVATGQLDAYDAISFMVPPGDPHSGLGIFDPDYLGWIDAGSGAPLLSRGGYIYAVLLEEFGHGLGLAHPHDTGGTSTVLEGVVADRGSYGVGALNQGVYTAMGYNEGWPAGPYGGAYYDGTWTYVNDFGYEAGPMALDIAVLQRKYGADLSRASGDDIYDLPGSNGAGTFYECIWDAGGRDAIRAAGAGAGAARIDLRPATLLPAEGGGGYLSYTSGVRGGYTIAAGVVIEDATGGPGDDTLIGNGAANALRGRDGADRLWGGAGPDTLAGGDGGDVLQGQVLDDLFDPASARIARLYKAALARWPETPGHLSWTERLMDGTPLLQIAAAVVASREFRTRYGDTSDTDFVTLLYGNVLGRAPDATGLASWLARLDGGESREAVVLGFSESAEFATRTIAGTLAYSRAGYQQDWSDDVFRLYRATLDRPPDVQGLEGWTDRLAAGTDFPDVVAGFTGSREFRTLYGTPDDAAFVTLLYANVLERDPDAAGFAGWIARLADGTPREAVVRGFSQSAEFRDRTAPLLEDWMERRAPDDHLDGGPGDDVLFGGILADTFRFSRAEGGRDTIADFEAWDTIVLDGFGFASPAGAAAAFVQDGADLVLFHPTGQIRLPGLQAGDLGADDLLLL